MTRYLIATRNRASGQIRDDWDCEFYESLTHAHEQVELCREQGHEPVLLQCEIVHYATSETPT